MLQFICTHHEFPCFNTHNNSLRAHELFNRPTCDKIRDLLTPLRCVWKNGDPRRVFSSNHFACWMINSLLKLTPLKLIISKYFSDSLCNSVTRRAIFLPFPNKSFKLTFFARLLLKKQNFLVFVLFSSDSFPAYSLSAIYSPSLTFLYRSQKILHGTSSLIFTQYAYCYS